MSDQETEAPAKILHGAARAAAEKKAAAQKTSLDEFVAGIQAGLEDKIIEATNAVHIAEMNLDSARRTLGMLEMFRRVGQGQPAYPEPAKPRQASQRAPRAEGAAIQQKIIETLKAGDSDGYPVSDLLSKVVPEGDDRSKQAVRNQLAQMTKKGSITRHSSGFYQLPA